MLTSPLFAARESFLHAPLFYKILGANALLIALISTALVMARGTQGSPDTVRLDVILVVGGLLLAIGVNAAILRLALSPLRKLQDAALRVQKGELEARVETSLLADRNLDLLIGTFNTMLDSIASYRDRMRNMAARVIAASEEERKKVARELHDGTAQSLAALLVHLRLARIAGDGTRRNELLDEVAREVADAIEEVRRIAVGLRPPALDELGIGAAIEVHARALSRIHGTQIDVRYDRIDDALAPDTGLAVYRVCQEALSNVVHHAGAARARVELRRSPSGLRVSIEDDGDGFRPDDVIGTDGRGLGLFGMQERVSYVGGRLDILSSPGQGTQIILEVPVKQGACT
jgi:two-component system sensor histidine kinase UhpB